MKEDKALRRERIRRKRKRLKQKYVDQKDWTYLHFKNPSKKTKQRYKQKQKKGDDKC